MHSEQGSALGTLEEAREKLKWPNVKDIGGQVPAILQKWFPAAWVEYVPEEEGWAVLTVSVVNVGTHYLQECKILCMQGNFRKWDNQQARSLIP